MAWTSPRTWAPGEDLTAANFNTHVRDNLKAIGDAWTAYTPTLTWTSSSFTFTRSGRYMQAGKLVHFWAKAVISGGTYGSGTGAPTLSLPVTAYTLDGLYGSIGGFYLDSGTNYYRINAGGASTTTVSMPYPGTNGVNTSPTSTVPFTWTTNDGFFIAGTYEAA